MTLSESDITVLLILGTVLGIPLLCFIIGIIIYYIRIYTNKKLYIELINIFEKETKNAQVVLYDNDITSTKEINNEDIEINETLLISSPIVMGETVNDGNVKEIDAKIMLNFIIKFSDNYYANITIKETKEYNNLFQYCLVCSKINNINKNYVDFVLLINTLNYSC